MRLLLLTLLFSCVVAVDLSGLGEAVRKYTAGFGDAIKTAALHSRVKGAFMSAIVADSLALGTHYEYDAKKIQQFYGTIDRFYAPGQKTGGQTHGVGWGSRNYHNGNGNGPAKRAGETTDYGDYNILLLEHLAKKAKQNNGNKKSLIELSELIPDWKDALATWRSWICTQTKQTLQQVQQGVPLHQIGGNSNAMAIRHIAAYAYYDNEEDIVHASSAAMFTHREKTALEGAEFFARVTFRIIHKGLTPRQAIDQVASQSPAFIKEKVQQAIDKVFEAKNPFKDLFKQEYVDDLALTSMARLWDVGKTEPIKVGKASPTEGTLPGSLYFILKYEGDFAKAAAANAAVGGDTASRAIAIGMVMGAHQGLAAIPDNLRSSLVGWDRLEGLLNQLPLLQPAKVVHSEL